MSAFGNLSGIRRRRRVMTRRTAFGNLSGFGGEVHDLLREFYPENGYESSLMLVAEALEDGLETGDCTAQPHGLRRRSGLLGAFALEQYKELLRYERFATTKPLPSAVAAALRQFEKACVREKAKR